MIISMLSLMLFTPAFIGTSTVKAQTFSDVEDFIEAADLGLDLIERIFCPDGPKLRCKGGVCLQGSCISFRSVCYEEGKKC